MKYILFLLSICFATTTTAQVLKPMSLPVDALFKERMDASPNLKVINDTLYVCGSNGLYCKDMMKNGNWELLGFKGYPVLDFVKNNNIILAALYNNTVGDTCLVLRSEDNGKTCKNVTTEEMHVEPTYPNCPYSLVQNPANPSSLHLTTTYDVYRSANTGGTWKKINTEWLYQKKYVYNPQDTTELLYYGCNTSQEGVVATSLSNRWVEPHGDSFILSVIINPYHPNLRYLSCMGYVYKSIDGGKSWYLVFEDTCSFFNLEFCQSNPDIIFLVKKDTYFLDGDEHPWWYIYASEDAGETWIPIVSYQASSSMSMHIWDILSYRESLYVLTSDDLFELELSDLLGIASCEKEPNAKVGTYDLQGRRVTSTPQGGIYIRDGKKYVQLDKR